MMFVLLLGAGLLFVQLVSFGAVEPFERLLHNALLFVSCVAVGLGSLGVAVSLPRLGLSLLEHLPARWGWTAWIGKRAARLGRGLDSFLGDRNGGLFDSPAARFSLAAVTALVAVATVTARLESNQVEARLTNDEVTARLDDESRRLVDEGFEAVDHRIKEMAARIEDANARSLALSEALRAADFPRLASNLASLDARLVDWRPEPLSARVDELGNHVERLEGAVEAASEQIAGAMQEFSALRPTLQEIDKTLKDETEFDRSISDSLTILNTTEDYDARRNILVRVRDLLVGASPDERLPTSKEDPTDPAKSAKALPGDERSESTQ
jgi:hypothetical protein